MQNISNNFRAVERDWSLVLLAVLAAAILIADAGDYLFAAET